MSNITVIGDVIVDIYNHGKIRGISAETPTMVMEKHDKNVFFGGAALVSRHICNRGYIPKLVTVCNEENFLDIKKLNDEIEYSFVFEENWKFSSKERFFVDGYKLFQVDDINKGKHTAHSYEEILKNIKDSKDVLILSDNRHGVIDKYIIQSAMSSNACMTVIDCQISQSTSNIDLYLRKNSKSEIVFLMNEKEFNAHADVLGICRLEDNTFKYDNLLRDMSKKLRSNIILKLGAKGSAAIIDNMYYRHTPDVKTFGEVVDTCGAGDAFLSVIATSMLNNPQLDLQIANNYAALSCTIMGTGTPNI